jgi:hypothetical protein
VEAALGRLEADIERALMDVSVLAYALDRDGLVVWQNHAHRRVIGDAHGSHLTEYAAPEDRRRATEAFMSTIVGNVRSTQYAVEVRAKAGPLQFEVNSVPFVRDRRGRRCARARCESTGPRWVLARPAHASAARRAPD